MPHAHILIHLQNEEKLCTAGDIHCVISSTEIPDPVRFPQSFPYCSVTKCMMHVEMQILIVLA